VLQKKKGDKWSKASCHTSELKAKSAMRARGMNEEDDILETKKIRLTKRQLKRLIREALLLERGEASASDISRYRPEIREWVETLVDAMADHVSEKIKEIDDKTRNRVVDGVTKVIVTELIGQFGHITHAEQQRFDKQDKEKAYRDYRKEKGWDPYG
jgi:hypothetical protein